MPERWAHVQGVAKRAAELGKHLPTDGDLLTSAAWLHDVGYSNDVRRRGFHPLDGAVFLRDCGWSERLCALVAHHSAAEVEAEFFGCAEHLRAFADERTLTRDLLWYCDMTVGPRGTPVSFTGRMKDVRARYTADSYVIKALEASMPERVGAVTRAQVWIDSLGAGDQL